MPVSVKACAKPNVRYGRNSDCQLLITSNPINSDLPLEFQAVADRDDALCIELRHQLGVVRAGLQFVRARENWIGPKI
jgi:hypothetical protein